MFSLILPLYWNHKFSLLVNKRKYKATMITINEYSESTHHPIPCLQSVMQEKKGSTILIVQSLLKHGYEIKMRH